MDQGTQFLNLLKNQIDTGRVPFSARGSRLLIYQEPGQSYLLVKLAFQDNQTLAIGLPPGMVTGIKFRVNPEMWIKSGTGGEITSVRNFALRTNGEIIKHRVTPAEEGYPVEFLVCADMDSTITLHINSSFDLEHEPLPFLQVSAAAASRWQNWFNFAPPVAEPYRQTYAYAWWVMGCNLLSPLGKLGFECTVPSKSMYIGIWLWDSAFHAIAYRHIDPALARDQIRAVLAHQLPNGMLPDAIHDEGVVTEIDHPMQGEVTKPPILAWAATKIHKTEPDVNFLQNIYEPLVRLNDWWFECNDDDRDGLAQYNHPYSSGLDDSPLWDHGMPVESPDLNTSLCIQMQSLAEMAEANALCQRLRATTQLSIQTQCGAVRSGRTSIIFSSKRCSGLAKMRSRVNCEIKHSN